MRLPENVPVENYITTLRLWADAIVRTDGDRDHMNPSRLTCEQTQAIARAMSGAAHAFERANLTSKQGEP